MAEAFKVRRVLLAATIVLGILPVRPLILAVSSYGSAVQQCLLHGSDCQCKAHCDQSTQHQREAHEAAAKPACHREPESQEALASGAASEPVTEAPASECAMTSCGKETPMLLATQGLPCLAASTAAAIPPQFSSEAVHAIVPLDFFLVEASPPTPPPES